MTNADKFKHLFGIYATELWAMPENDFLEWLNADAQDMPTAEHKTGKWIGYNIEKDGWKRTDGSPVFMRCSECNGIVLNNGSPHWNFCPKCGSYNGGAE